MFFIEKIQTADENRLIMDLKRTIDDRLITLVKSRDENQGLPKRQSLLYLFISADYLRIAESFRDEKGIDPMYGYALAIKAASMSGHEDFRNYCLESLHINHRHVSKEIKNFMQNL